MNRRRFLGAILATCTAPAIVRASSLMPGKGVVIVDDLAIMLRDGLLYRGEIGYIDQFRFYEGVWVPAMGQNRFVPHEWKWIPIPGLARYRLAG